MSYKVSIGNIFLNLKINSSKICKPYFSINLSSTNNDTHYLKTTKYTIINQCFIKFNIQKKEKKGS